MLIRGIFKRTALCVFLSGCLVAAIGQAAAEDARVLPQGVFRFTYARTQSGSISDYYNPGGHSESLTAPYDMKLDAQTLSQIPKTPISGLTNFLTANWLYLHYNASGVSNDPNDPLVKDSLSRGDLDVSAEGTMVQNTFALQYGVTQRLSVGLIVPRVSTSVRTSATISGENSAEKIRRFFATDQSGLYTDFVAGLAQLSSLQVENFQKIIEGQGYQRFQDTEQSGFGDVTLGARYNYHNSKRWLHSVQTSLSMPTGSLKDPASLTQIDQGAGAFQAGIAQITNFFPAQNWTLSTGLHYVRSLQSSRKKRTYSTDSANMDSYLPGPNREEEVNFTLGDKVWATLGADYSFSSVVSVGAGFEMNWKGVDAYSGHFDDGDYERMSRDTNSDLRAAQLSLGLTTTELYQAKRFPVPFDAKISYFRPLAGRNTIIAPYWTGEVSMYF